MLAFLRSLFAGAQAPAAAARPVEMPLRRLAGVPLAEEAARLAPGWNEAAVLEEALRDYSGYFRQAAIVRCVELRLPNALTLVASRLNDWVPQVRKAAQEAMLELLPAASRDEQLNALHMVGALRNAGRTNHEAWIAEFEKSLLAAVGEQALWEGLGAGTRLQARACFELLVKLPGVQLARLLTLCVASRDDIMLALRAANMAYLLEAEHSLPVLTAAMDSHFGSVRRVALQKLLQGADGPQLAPRYLLDQHATVRGLAIACLRGADFDLPGFYRAVLCDVGARPARTRIALLSLAALNQKGDLLLVKGFLRNEAISVRAAAYAAWFKLAPGEKDEMVLQAFADGSASVRKFARWAMDRHGAYIAFADIYRIFGKSAMTLDLMPITHSHKWNWLEAIAIVARGLPPDAPLRAGLADELRSWIYDAKWSRHRPIGNQAQDLSDAATMAALEGLLAGEDEQLAQLREQVASAGATSQG